MAKKESKDIVIEKTGRTPEEILKSVLDSEKESHDNYKEPVDAGFISTGSLTLDMEMGGGIYAAGLIRMVGFTEGGKTSQSLEFARNFLKKIPKARVYLAKAEGRLSEEMQKRLGLNLVWDASQWKEGTVFVHETHEYEHVIKTIRDLVQFNDNGYRYCFILDSMDALIIKSDLEKEITDNSRVAGAPSLTKKFLQRMGRAMGFNGHLCIMIGQVSSKIEISEGAQETRQISATGGNAALHWSNWILQFEARWNGDRIMDDEKKPYDAVKNKIYGHWAKVVIKKSPNETSGKTIKYPIKYGKIAGSSIWREYEIVDALKVFKLIEMKGAGWYTISELLIKELKDNGLDIPEKIQGTDKFQDYLEANPKLTDYLFEKCLRMLTADPKL
jgi:RecA/RadA recombinase